MLTRGYSSIRLFLCLPQPHARTANFFIDEFDAFVTLHKQASAAALVKYGDRPHLWNLEADNPTLAKSSARENLCAL
jgi:hypothetical protein